MTLRNRIVSTGEAPAGEFLANPDNWRIHPYAQQEAIDANLEALGWVAPVIVNRTTGHLVDGHARVNRALERGDDTPVPYIMVDLTPDEERAALASLDPLSAMAVADAPKLAELMGEAELPPPIVTELASILDGHEDVTDLYETPRENVTVSVECESVDAREALREELRERGYRVR